jgi:hypothetical protein
MRHTKPRLLVLILSLLPIPLLVRAGDISAGAFAGTWKFNLSKSKFPGPPPTVDMFTMGADGRITISETNADGKSSSWSYKPQEGQAVPVEGRGPNVTVTVHRANDHRIEHTWNFDGRTAKSYSVLSKDGKTQTFHIAGTDKDGKPFEETVVYEKQ